VLWAHQFGVVVHHQHVVHLSVDHWLLAFHLHIWGCIHRFLLFFEKDCDSELKQLKRIPPETIANIVENKKKLDLAREECR